MFVIVVGSPADGSVAPRSPIGGRVFLRCSATFLLEREGTMEPGFFDLRTVRDLREKMRKELDNLKKNPLSVYAAFNFFVTAEHMVDWLHPTDEDEHKNLRRNYPLLATCSHLANGGKHFILKSKWHKSVSSAMKTDDWNPPNWNPSESSPPGWNPEARLIVCLDGKAAEEHGSTIGVIELAEKLMAHWEAEALPS
jgi:hypothetical protein